SGAASPRELLAALAADVRAEPVHDGLLAERTQQRKLQRLRQQRQAEVEVEDVRLRREPREGTELRGLAREQARRPVEAPVRLRVERVALEDDEPRVDALAAERFDVRPRNAGGVDRAVGDAQSHSTWSK